MHFLLQIPQTSLWTRGNHDPEAGAAPPTTQKWNQIRLVLKRFDIRKLLKF